MRETGLDTLHLTRRFCHSFGNPKLLLRLRFSTHIRAFVVVALPPLVRTTCPSSQLSALSIGRPHAPPLVRTCQPLVQSPLPPFTSKLARTCSGLSPRLLLERRFNMLGYCISLRNFEYCASRLCKRPSSGLSFGGRDKQRHRTFLKKPGVSLKALACSSIRCLTTVDTAFPKSSDFDPHTPNLTSYVRNFPPAALG